jgi:hypothetical protein
MLYFILSFLKRKFCICVKTLICVVLTAVGGGDIMK